MTTLKRLQRRQARSALRAPECALHMKARGTSYAAIATAIAALAGLLAVAGPASPAAAATARGGLTVHTFAHAGEFSEAPSPYEVVVTNSGSQAVQEPVAVKATLPAGFSATVQLFELLPVVPNGVINSFSGEPLGGCEAVGGSGNPVNVTCPVNTGSGVLAPNEAVRIVLTVAAQPGTPSGRMAQASASAPGVPDATVSEPLTVASAPLSFGPSALVSYIAGSDGEVDQQAGDHPFSLTTQIDLNNVFRALPTGVRAELDSVQDLKDVVVDLPAGVVGDAQVTPKCTFAELGSHFHCPFDTRIGQIHTQTPEQATVTEVYGSLFNMVPEHGVAAEFGFIDGLKSSHAIYATVAPSPSGYVVRAVTREVPQVALRGVTATIFGDPATADETEERGPHSAMFTNPSDCSGQAGVSTVHLDSWEEPGIFHSNATPEGEPEVGGEHWVSASSDQWPKGGSVTPATSAPVTGCNLLRFQPSGFTVKPDTETADSPTGLDFDLKIPQDEHFGQLATPPLKNATVVMPAGMSVDPSAANGLQACSVAEIGWLGADGPHGEALPNKGVTNFNAKAPACPDASKIGSVEVISALTEKPLVGSVYLARQQENPFGSLFAAYIVIDDPTTGIVVKVPGELQTNPQTGQITGVFDQNPQLPFSDLKLRFFGGEHGDLATPEACGAYTTTSDFEPWSAPESGPNATPSASFNITGGCVSAFAPAFTAGTVTNQAGSYSPFLLSISKGDDEQGLAGLTVTLPPGLIGKISGVGECSEAQVAAAEARGGLGQGAQELASPSCPSSSLLGTVTTASGPGPDPVSVTGKAYLTGPYKGAPYGMAVVVPALAGPFDLGVVVIRQALFINPVTSQVTDVSDPFPTIRDGVPLRIQRIDVNLNRPEFTLNPTSCEAKAINATATSIPGAHAALSSHYQAAGCSSLAFKPSFTASTQANGTRKGRGASLDVKIGYPRPFTAYANILKVDTSLPLALSSRLTTLQKACTETQFAANPAGCPPASAIGIATAVTPLLPAPLTGPAYLVSHGGRAFPDLDIVLQGNNVTIDLTGNTDIKHGITYSKFESAPDAPVSSFELNLPEKENSILAAVKNLCAPTRAVTVKKRVTERVHGRSKTVTKRVKSTVAEPLVMPTSMTAQNGAVINQNISVAVTGCHKAKPAKKVAKKKKGKRKK